MANPTETEVQDQIKEVVEHYDDFLTACTSSPNILGNIDAVVDLLETEFFAEVTDALRGDREALRRVIENEAATLTPFVKEYGRVVNAPENADIPAINARIARHLHDNAKTINSRGFTFGTPAAAGGNTGNGVINRLNTDRFGYKIENQFADAKIATILRDRNSGATVHQEVFEFRGADPSIDALALAGSGAKSEVPAIIANTNFLNNPSFDTFSDGADFDDWTKTGTGTITQDTVNFYRDISNGTAEASAELTGNVTLAQDLTALSKRFDPNVPVYFQLAYENTNNVSGGTLLVTLGSVSFSVADLSVGSGWNILRMPIGTNNWFDNFNADPLTLTIAVSGTGSGSVLLIDDIVFAPFVEFDHSWYAPVGGQTPWLREDKFTWTDTETAGQGKIQRSLFRAFDVYYPSNDAGAETWTDP